MNKVLKSLGAGPLPRIRTVLIALVVVHVGRAPLPTPAVAQESEVASRRPSLLERPIHVESSDNMELVSVAIDGRVYEHARPDLNDVRIVNRQGEEISFVSRRQARTAMDRIRKSWPVVDYQLQLSPDEGLVIRFQLHDEDPQPDGLRIVTPLTDFEQSLDLFAVDGDHEVQLIDSEMLFDYSKYMNVRRVDVSIPPTSAREFRLVIGSPTSDEESAFLELTRELQADAEQRRQETFTIQRRPFRIDRLELWTNVEQPAARSLIMVEYPLAMTEPRHDPERKETRIRLGTRFAPLQRLHIETSSRNFRRHVRVMARDESGRFTRQIGSAEIQRLSFQSLQQELLDVPIRFDPVPFRGVDQNVGANERDSRDALELVIENRDSPPLVVTNVLGFGHVDELVFFATPGEEYRLVYGGGLGTMPDYDTAALDAVLRDAASPQVATLGPPRESAHRFTRPPRRLSDIFTDPWVFGPVIVVLVVLLGWGLVRAAERVDADHTS